MTKRNEFLLSIILLGALGFGPIAGASPQTFQQTYSGGFQNNGLIPDGSLAGWTDTRTVAMAEGLQVLELRVTLDISGGYNGDLYAYLAHGSGFSVLLNRIGVGDAQGDAFGFAGSGLSLTLASGAGLDNVHWHGGGAAPTGTFLADGRAIDPLSAPALFDTAGTGANLDAMAGLDPNGQWTLFFADVSAGGGNSILTGWSLEIVAVPEPSTTALAALGMAIAAAAACSSRSWARFR